MSESILNQVKLFCKQYGIDPKKSKGQNFLINHDVIDQIINAANLKLTDRVLEVGPGLGILTEDLIKQAKKVISVELDNKLFNFLKANFVNVKNLELINDDILKINPKSYKLKATSYKVVANIPYNITSHFLKKFLTAYCKPSEMTILIQKEVAQRICAKVGKMSLLAVSVQLYGQPEIVDVITKDNFWPAPKIDSAILKIKNIKDQSKVDNYLGDISEKRFWQIVRIGFSAKRKQLQNNLSAGLNLNPAEVKNWLKKANLDPMIRPQNLSVSDWLTVVKLLS